jgi:periplasmic protein TonB
MADAEGKGLRARLPLLAVLAVVLLLAAFLGWYILKALNDKSSKPPRTVQTIQVVRPPPPPPEVKPPPPPPPPEKVEKFEQASPEPTPNDEPAPAENLALDAAGSAGGDAFGFGSRPGGRDLIGGSGTAPFGAAQARLGSQLNELLSGDSRLKGKRFKGSVRVRIAEDGRIVEASVVSSTGDSAIDSAIQSGLLSKRVDPLPVEMPQPVTLYVVRKS